ncbi:MAG TPA: glycosyltransferase family 4 protein [Terriglobales bacterium]|nr:glycosyltransferase family 4 protein [Terriglobales bacterium]
MHVLVTADTVGGVWTYTKELVTGLAQRGVRVTLVSFGEIPKPGEIEWLVSMRSIDFYPTAFRLEWMQDAERDLRLSSEYLLRIVSESKPDLLHLSQYAYGALAVDIPKLVIAHSDVVSWWVAVHGREPERSAWIDSYRDTVERGLSEADTVVAPSRWMMNALQAHYGKLKVTRVIYNGRNPVLFNPHCSKEELVLGAGRVWDPGKQVRMLEAVNSPWPIVVAGPNESPDQAAGQHASATKYGGIDIRGTQTAVQLQQLYARASMFVGTSRYEPFGLAPLEAAFSRCVLVLNDIPSFREIWGESACYFRANDATELERTLISLAEDRQLRLTYSNLAYRRAKSFYTANRMVDQYMQLYSTLITEKVAAA